MDREANRVGAELLFTDCDLAMTFLDVAANSQNPETVQRNLENARKAYETVIRLMPKLAFTAAENQEIRSKLSELKRRLQAAERI